MPDQRRTRCQSCGGNSGDVGPISWRGNCETCGRERQTQSIIELAAHRGPMYRRWKLAMFAAIERS